LDLIRETKEKIAAFNDEGKKSLEMTRRLKHVRKKLFSSLIGVVLCAIMVATMIPLARGADFTLTLVNPKAAIEAPELVPLTERLDTLAGKRIGFVGYSKDAGLGTAASYASSISDLIQEVYPTTEIITQYAHSYSDVLGQKGIANYDLWARGSTGASVINGVSATRYSAQNPSGVDAIISGVAN
jgi:hypothetical protein